MFQGTSDFAGIQTQQVSGLFIVKPNTQYAPATAWNIVGTSTLNSTGRRLIWWPDRVAYQSFTAAGTWHSPPGNKGPVLTYNNKLNSGSFNGLAFGYVDGLTGGGGVTCVQVAGVEPNTDYSVSGSIDSPTIVLYFP